MGIIGILWSGVAGGVDNAKEIFQNGIIPHVASGRSVEHLMTRASEPHQTVDAIVSVLLPIEAVIIVLIFLAIEYTLFSVFPVLAIVEDDATESYEAVANKDTELEEPEGNKTIVVDEDVAARPKPVTSGLYSTYRHLRSIGGRRSLLRGVRCWISLRLANVAITLLLTRVPFIPAGVAWPITFMLTLPLYTAWTHIVVTEPSNKPFWHRLPQTSLVYRAGGRAALLFSAVGGLEAFIVSVLLNALIGLKASSRGSVLTWLLSIIASFVVWICIVIPAHAVLIRVQVSMLSEEDRTIVPLHRLITAHRAEGREYMSTLDAWRFPRATWKRLFKLYAKAILLCFLLEAVVALIALGEFFLIIYTRDGK